MAKQGMATQPLTNKALLPDLICAIDLPLFSFAGPCSYDPIIFTPPCVDLRAPTPPHLTAPQDTMPL